MKAIKRTADYADLIDEHTYIQRLISEGSLADVLITFYELRLTEIENEISDYNEKLLNNEDQKIGTNINRSEIRQDYERSGYDCT